MLIGVGSALIPGHVARDAGFTSEAELRDLVDLAEERQVIESREREMIHSVFELGETLAREVMVPRTDMVWIEQGKSVRQALSLALRSGFSRIPVIGANEDDVVGVAYLKDLARRAYDAEGQTAERVIDLMRPAYFIPESKPVDELLRDMQAKQVHVAIVIDEYGGTAGLVTIEDILEEIVGEIADEYDREEPRVEQLEDGRVRVNVRLPVDDIEEMFDVRFDLEDVETVGGLLAAELGRVPIPGASVSAQGLTFIAEGAKGRRKQIGTVLITRDATQRRELSRRRAVTARRSCRKSRCGSELRLGRQSRWFEPASNGRRRCRSNRSNRVVDRVEPRRPTRDCEAGIDGVEPAEDREQRRAEDRE